MSHPAGGPVDGPMQRIGEEAARLFRRLSGQDPDEPVSSYVVALYSLLFLVAFALFDLWVTNTPI